MKLESCPKSLRTGEKRVDVHEDSGTSGVTSGWSTLVIGRGPRPLKAFRGEEAMGERLS